MTVSELIEALQKMPQDATVNVFDWRKNFFAGGGDWVSDGIEEVKGCFMVPDDETTELMNEDGDEIEQWVAIKYDNDDYTEKCEPCDDSNIADYFYKQK